MHPDKNPDDPDAKVELQRISPEPEPEP